MQKNTFIDTSTIGVPNDKMVWRVSHNLLRLAVVQENFESGGVQLYLNFEKTLV